MEFEFARNKQASKQANVPLSHMNGPTRTRSNHDFKNRPRAARTNYFKFSFFNRYVNDNSLVHNSPSSLNCFKTRLFNYFLTSHILLFLTVFGFFSFFVSYLSSFSSFFFSYIMYSYTPYLDILF